MHKWYFHSAIGRGRPLPVSHHPNYTSAFPPHCLHTSTLRQQNAGQDVVMRGAATPIPNRAQRLRGATLEMENLYYKSAAKGGLIFAQQNTTSRAGSSRQGAPNSQPAVLKDEDVGVPLSQEVLEGQVPSKTIDQRPRYNNYDPRLENVSAGSERTPSHPRNLGARRGPGDFTMGRTGAVDARKLGARPELGSITKERIGVVDARNLRARPASTEKGLGATVPNEVPQEYRKDTTGLEPKQRYPTRQPYEENEAPQMGSMRDDSGFQGRMPQGSGDYKPREARQPDRAVQENAFNRRGPQLRRGGAQSGRVGRPRASRSDEGDERRRRRPNKDAASGNDYGGKTSTEEMYNEAEKKYVKQKSEREATQSIVYEPGDVSRETFSGVGPAVVSGEWGLSEILGERLLLAKKHLDGEFVEWHSKEQKADVMTLVERLKDKKESEQQTQNLMQKLLGGKYEFTKPQQEKDILGNVARHTDRNESYFPVDQQSLFEKVKSLIPADDVKKDRRA